MLPIDRDGKTEIWFHEDCFIWIPNTFLVGGRLVGLEEGVEQCQKQEECQGECQDNNMICGGGNVIFNTSHQNHLDTISVELRWLCDKVPDRLACILRSTT